jgi:hypothetical protein
VFVIDTAGAGQLNRVRVLAGGGSQPLPDLLVAAVGAALVDHDGVLGVPADRGIQVAGLMRDEVTADRGGQLIR